MFLLNDKPLALDAAFTVDREIDVIVPAVMAEDGSETIVSPERIEKVMDLIQYPANWLRNATEQEREELGIVEVPDEPQADDRFYWDGDVSNPKDLASLKTQWIAQIKQTANSMLAQTDWMELRALTRKIAVPKDVADFRQAIIAYVNDLEAQIVAAKNVGNFVSVVTSQQWPSNEPVVQTPEATPAVK